jgi:hypothetical protein
VIVQTNMHHMVTIGVLMLTACGGSVDRVPGPATPAHVVRDSTGIEIVESSRPFWKEGDGWKVDAARIVVIGTLDGPAESQLHRVVGARRLSDGRIVIAENGTPSLRVFDDSGAFVRVIGRRGTGPGEYASLNELLRIRGDTLLVHDERNRLHTFTGNGEFVSQRTASRNEELVLDIAAAYDDGTLVLPLRGEGYTPRNEDEKARTMYELMRRNGESAGRFGFIRKVRPAIVTAHPQSKNRSYEAVMSGKATYRIAEMRMHQPNLYVAIGPSGFFHGDSEAFEIHATGPAGDLRRIMRVILPLDSIPEHVKQDTVSVVVGTLAIKPDKLIWPPVYPAFSGLVADREGNLWARRVPRPGQPPGHQVYNVFGTNGALLGEVVIPLALSLFEIGSDYILGLKRDEMDVESVVMLRIAKGGGK